LKLLELLEEKQRRASRNKLQTFFSTPAVRAQYPKQIQFFGETNRFNEVALFGGNRSGKTVAGTYMDTLHLTGLYPDWWPGSRFQRPTEGWAAGDTGKNVRDILQYAFLGKPGDESSQGTGMIPGDLILRTTTKHGLADAVETIFVRHVPTGGVSTLQLKSYDQGRVAFQGTSQDFIHLDEEPPLDIYAESLLRTMTTNGLITLTATPLQGLTQLMLEFLPELKPADSKDLDVAL
jgi:phage terminase large subunit-like protein